jgi:hypothetical protein
MKVWYLEFRRGEYSDKEEYFLGLYTSKEKATEALERYRCLHKEGLIGPNLTEGEFCHGYGEYRIFSLELDKDQYEPDEALRKNRIPPDITSFVLDEPCAP